MATWATCKERNDAIKAMRLLWLDLETTGLDPLKDQILEVGAIVTDGFLKEVARNEFVIKAGAETLANMPPVVIAMHAESGLSLKCLTSPLEIYEVDFKLTAWAYQHGVTKKSFLAGNSVGDFDRHFMRRLMPQLNDGISHRSVNVSTFKALFSMWDPDVAAPKLERVKAHRSILDCEHAIEELKHWLEHAETLGYALADAGVLY